MISKLDYLIELKKLKSLNELVIEDNPVLVLKESNDILRCLPIKIKQKDLRDQKNKPNSPLTTGIVSHTSSAGGNLNKNLQGTPNQQNNSNSNYYSSSLLKSNYSMNNDLNNNLSGLGTINSGNPLSISQNNVTSGLVLNNNLINTGNVNGTMFQTNKSNQFIIGKKNLSKFNFFYIFKTNYLLDEHSNISLQNNNLGPSSLANPPSASVIGNSQTSVNSNATDFKITTSLLSGNPSSTQMNYNPNNNATEASSADIANIVSHIQKEWQTEYNFIVENGYNGYHSKRLKDSKIVSGHAELEGTNKLNIYGNALEVLDQTEFYENISIIDFEYFNIDMITNRKIIEKLKKFAKISKLIFSNNNIHSFYQLLKFEDFNDIESITIINNEINNANLLKYFLIYRFQKIKFYNDLEISSKDVMTAKKIYEYFDKCISCGENKKREKKQIQQQLALENLKKSETINTNKDNSNGNNIDINVNTINNNENIVAEKTPIDKIDNYETIKEERENLILKRILLNYVTKHLTDVLEEIVDEE